MLEFRCAVLPEVLLRWVGPVEEPHHVLGMPARGSVGFGIALVCLEKALPDLQLRAFVAPQARVALW